MIRRLAVMAMTAALAGCGQPATEPEPRAVEPASAPAAAPAPAPTPPTTVADPAAASAPGMTCRDELGAEAAQELVDRCIAVSPATHPPCNAENSCALIQSEIDRGCEMLGDQGPGFCGTH